MIQQKCASGQQFRPDGRNDQTRDGVHRRRAHEDKIPATTSQLTRTHSSVGKRIYIHHAAATTTFSFFFAKTISTTACNQLNEILCCCSRRLYQDKNSASTPQTTRNERPCTAEGRISTQFPPFRHDSPNDQNAQGCR